jgi:uncharacterized membrane protein
LNEPVEKSISKWEAAGVIDAATAARIRAFEASQASMERLRWPVLIALGLGGLVICAGVLLFVAAHWDQLSPGERFGVVLLLTGIFPVLGAFAAARFPALATTLFAVGTVTTGAGIFTAAQIFNLEEHWPNGILLWLVAALAGWFLLQEWPQAAAVAMLGPAWLGGEWMVRTEHYQGTERILFAGLACTAIAYFTIDREKRETNAGKALIWIGAIAILPLIAMLAASGNDAALAWRAQTPLPHIAAAVGWIVALFAPLAFAYFMRGRKLLFSGVATLWVVLCSVITDGRSLEHSITIYLWLAIGAVGLIGWGMLERVKDRVNIGVVGFALTVLGFYFSNVMDKLGRSASLIGLGILLIAGGWVMERTRRRLVARVAESKG